MEGDLQPAGTPQQDRSADQRRRLAWLSRWWDGGAWHKVAIIAAIPLLLSCACCSGGLIFAATPQGQQFAREADATSTAQSLADAHATATASVYALAHPTPTANARNTPQQTTTTPHPTATLRPMTTASAPPSGYPHAGGPLSDFIEAYGQPFQQVNGGATDDFYADSTQTIIISADFSNKIVNNVTVLGHTSWSNQQTFAYCTQFLPNGATEFNSAPPYTDYQSGTGEVVIANYGQGSCQVYLA